jgi:hypothetical protein
MFRGGRARSDELGLGAAPQERPSFTHVDVAGKIHGISAPLVAEKGGPRATNVAGKHDVWFSEDDALSNATERLRSMEPGFAHYDIEDQSVSTRLIIHCSTPISYCIYHTEACASMQGKPNANSHKTFAKVTRVVTSNGTDFDAVTERT